MAISIDLLTSNPALPRSGRDLYDRLHAKIPRRSGRSSRSLVTPEPQSACVPTHVALRRHPAAADGCRPADHRERSRAPRPRPREPGPARPVADHPEPLRRVQLDHAGRGRAEPSPRRLGAALRHRRRRAAYTAVDGERTTMRPGDFVLTPFWTFHDHGNPGGEPVIWLDGLDVPIVNLFDASFADHHRRGNAAADAPRRRRARALRRRTCCRSNTSRAACRRRCSAIRTPARARSSTRCIATARSSAPRRQDAVREPGDRRLSDADHRRVHSVPAGGLRGRRRTARPTRPCYCVAEGRGRTPGRRASFAWGPHDIFVAPSWQRVSHEAQEDAVLFSFSDRAAQKALGVWRED